MDGGTGEKFCLRWNDFENNISTSFRELREDKDFFDVTLVCDDNQLQAHKVILSACSPFFRSVLKRNPHQHPLLYLKGVKYEDILSVLNFMYHGEVNVAQEELNSFLAVAEDLQVKGLTQTQNNKNRTKNHQPPPPESSSTKRYPEQTVPVPRQNKQPRIKTALEPETFQARKEIQEIIPPQIKTEAPVVLDSEAEPENTHEMVEAGDYPAEHGGYEYKQSYQDPNLMYQGGEMEMDMSQMGENTQDRENQESFMWNTEWTNKQFSCDICYKEFSNKKSLQNHRNIHKGRTKCPVCEKVFSTTSNMNLHMRNTHAAYNTGIPD